MKVLEWIGELQNKYRTIYKYDTGPERVMGRGERRCEYKESEWGVGSGAEICGGGANQLKSRGSCAELTMIRM